MLLSFPGGCRDGVLEVHRKQIWNCKENGKEWSNEEQGKCHVAQNVNRHTDQIWDELETPLLGREGRQMTLTQGWGIRLFFRLLTILMRGKVYRERPHASLSLGSAILAAGLSLFWEPAGAFHCTWKKANLWDGVYLQKKRRLIWYEDIVSRCPSPPS